MLTWTRTAWWCLALPRAPRASFAGKWCRDFLRETRIHPSKRLAAETIFLMMGIWARCFRLCRRRTRGFGIHRIFLKMRAMQLAKRSAELVAMEKKQLSQQLSADTFEAALINRDHFGLRRSPPRFG